MLYVTSLSDTSRHASSVQALKECVDEIDLGTQYHLSRYAFLCESIIHGEAIILQPKDDNSMPLKCMYMVRS